MPIFEYACRSCGHSFEALVFGGKVPPCPECKSADLEKLLSSFAVGGAPSASALPPGCSAPSGGG
jgi:putative FmdB family regulatory protein